MITIHMLQVQHIEKKSPFTSRHHFWKLFSPFSVSPLHADIIMRGRSNWCRTHLKLHCSKGRDIDGGKNKEKDSTDSLLDRCTPPKKKGGGGGGYFKGSKVKKDRKKDYSVTVRPLNRSEREREKKKKKRKETTPLVFFSGAEQRRAQRGSWPRKRQRSRHSVPRWWKLSEFKFTHTPHLWHDWFSFRVLKHTIVFPFRTHSHGPT